MRGVARPSKLFVSIVSLALIIPLFAAAFSSFGMARAAAQEEVDDAQPAGQNVNVELILDSSGSMAEQTNTGEPRIEAARTVLTDVITQIPDDRPNINVGFRVFGHEGDNTDTGRAESCQSSDLFVPIEGVDKAALQGQVDSYQPVGWTPIALSLDRALEDFPDDSEGVTNAIILVTDGLETCADNPDTAPCDAASALFDGAKSVQVNVVGLGLAEDEVAILQCIADNGGGALVNAQNATELSAALFTFLQELEVVVSNGFFEIEDIGGLYPRATITGQGGATDSNPEGEPFSVTLTDSNRIELAIGTYDVSWTNPSGQLTQIRVNIEADRDTFVRGSILEFPQGAGEIYTVADVAGIILWQDQFELGDRMWVLPGIYKIRLLELVGNPILIAADLQTLPGTVTKLEVLTAP